MRHIQARVSDNEFEQFKIACAKLGVTMEQLIVESIKERISQPNGGQTTTPLKEEQNV